MHTQNLDRHAAILAQIEAAMLALLRDANDPDAEFDAVTVRGSLDSGQTCIDVEYLHGSIPVAGESL